MCWVPYCGHTKFDKIGNNKEPFKSAADMGKYGTNSWVQDNNGYKLHEEEWKYTSFSHNLPFLQYYAAVIFPTPAKHVKLYSMK